jgi:tetratricopeptide (TPR) repeat protein
MDLTPEQEGKLKEAILKLNYLIADPTSSRKSIRSLLIQIGIKPNFIHVVEDFAEAEKTISEKKPQVVFIDETIAGERVLDLVKLQASCFNPGDAAAFFFLSSKNSNSVASNAAEDNLDAVLMKPFTFEALKNEVFDILCQKFQPTEYQKTILKGKGLLEAGKQEEALPILQSAIKLDPKSAQPQALIGQAYFQLGKIKEARAAYDEGLKLTPTHYRCHIGLLELLLQEKDYPEAYRVSRKMAEHHPVPMKKLPDLIRLSIWNKKYKDVLEFYKVAESVSQVDNVVSKFMAAGLAVCGLYFMQTQNQTSAIDAFRKAEVISKSDPKILTRILSALITAGMDAELKTFLSRATDEVKDSVELKIAKLDYFSKKNEIAQALEQAMRFINEGVKDPRIHKVAIQTSIYSNRKKQTILELIEQAKSLFPEHKEEFTQLEAKAQALPDR